MTKECVKESINGIDALLTGCREIRAECAEGVGAIFGSESARDFLFHFNHADIAFGLILEGAVPAALLAIIIQYVFEFLERFLVSNGLKN